MMLAIMEGADSGWLALQIQCKAKTLAQDEDRYLDQKGVGEQGM